MIIVNIFIKFNQKTSIFLTLILLEPIEVAYVQHFRLQLTNIGLSQLNPVIPKSIVYYCTYECFIGTIISNFP